MDRSDLEYIRILNDKIHGGLLRIDELKSKALPGAIVYDDTGASKPMPVNKLEHIFELIDAEEHHVNRLIDKRYALKTQALSEIQAFISADNMAMRHILYLRYLSNDNGENLSWPDVAKHIQKYHNIQLPRIYQLHHHAVLLLSHHKI